MIESPRLRLPSFTPAFYRLSLAGEVAAAEALLGCSIDPAWFHDRDIMEMRSRDLERDPTLLPWLLRGVVLEAERQMVGYIGFHTRPGAEYLATLSPGGVEIGYTIFPAYRRQGFAREATLAMFDWAQREHGVSRFVASVSPENVASVRLIQSLGFQLVGGHQDETDGYEDIYERIYKRDVYK